MGNRGRYGKYGEIKRTQRLRQARMVERRRLRLDTSSHGSYPFPDTNHRTPPLKIRPAKKTDIPFIGELSARVFRLYGPYDIYIPDWFKLETTLTLIAIHGNKKAGFAMAGQLSAAWNPD